MPVFATSADSNESYTEKPNAIVCLFESTAELVHQARDRLVGLVSLCAAASCQAGCGGSSPYLVMLYGQSVSGGVP